MSKRNVRRIKFYLTSGNCNLEIIEKLKSSNPKSLKQASLWLIRKAEGKK